MTTDTTRDDALNALDLVARAAGIMGATDEELGTALDAALSSIREARGAERVVYEVGMPDPTTVDNADGWPCLAQDDGWICTWPTGHDHPQHVAGAITKIVHVWPVVDPPAAVGECDAWCDPQTGRHSHGPVA